MGFFDKIKKAVGKTGIELTYTWIEDPLTFGDPMIKATVTVTATDGAATELVASCADEEEADVILGEVSEEHEPYSTTTRNGESVPVFPHTLQQGESEGFGIFLDGLDLAKSLEHWGVTDVASAREAGIELVLETEVDIKETSFMFDPIITQTITLK